MNMKAIKKLFFISIICLCFGTSCERPQHKYYNIPEEYLSAGLYYSVAVGDTFYLLKNSIDTNECIVVHKELSYETPTYDNYNHYQVLELFLNDYYHEIMTLVNAGDELSGTPKIVLDFTSELAMAGTIELSNYSDTVNNIYYSDLYKTTSVANPSDYIITSRSQGIVYIQVDTTTYARIY
jgi:hypothetical protein